MDNKSENPNSEPTRSGGTRVENLLRALNEVLDMNPSNSNSSGNQECPQNSNNQENSEISNQAIGRDVTNLGSQSCTTNDILEVTSSENQNQTPTTNHSDVSTNNNITTNNDNDVTDRVNCMGLSHSEPITSNDSVIFDQAANTSSGNASSPNVQMDQANRIAHVSSVQQGAKPHQAEGRSENSENSTGAGAAASQALDRTEDMGAEAASKEYADDDEEAKESLLAKKLTVVMEKLEAYRATRDYMVALANKLKEENARYETEFGINTEEEVASEGNVNATSGSSISENNGIASSGGNIIPDSKITDGTADGISRNYEGKSNSDTASRELSQPSISPDPGKPFQAQSQIATNQSTCMSTIKCSAAGESYRDNETTNKIPVPDNETKNKTPVPGTETTNETPVPQLNYSSPVSLSTVTTKQAGQSSSDHVNSENKEGKKPVEDHEADECDDDLDYDDDYYDVSEDIDYVYEEDDNDDIETELVTPSSQINKPHRQRNPMSGDKCKTANGNYSLQNADTNTSTKVNLSHSEEQNQCQIKEKNQWETKEHDKCKTGMSEIVAIAVNKSAKVTATGETGYPSNSQTKNQDDTKLTACDPSHSQTASQDDRNLSASDDNQVLANAITDSSTKAGDSGELMYNPSATSVNDDNQELQINAASKEDQQKTCKREGLPSDEHRYLNMSRVERLNLMLRLQTEFAKLQLQLVHVQESMRAATAVLQKLATLEHDDQS